MTPPASVNCSQYFSPEGLQLREDLRVDDVELRLDLVAAHVVHGGNVLVEDQVFSGGWKPVKKQLCLDGVWISTATLT